MCIYKPYVYLIGWTKTNVWYYGVRYALGCDPSDLWTKYFTSSKYVNKFREEFGEPDKIITHKTFITTKDAIEYELYMLNCVGATTLDCWLNKHIPEKNFNGLINRNKTYDEIHGIEKAKKLKKIRSDRMLGNKFGVGHSKGKGHPKEKHSLWKVGHTIETKQKISKTKIGKLNPRYDNISCTFFHKDYGSFTGTRYDLLNKYPQLGLNIQQLKKVRENILYSHKGWILSIGE